MARRERSRGQTHLSRLLEEVRQGGGRNRQAAKPVARLSSRDRGSKRRQPGSARVRSCRPGRLRRPLPDEILSRSSAEGIADTHAFCGSIDDPRLSEVARDFVRRSEEVLFSAAGVAGRWRSRSDCVEVTGL